MTSRIWSGPNSAKDGDPCFHPNPYPSAVQTFDQCDKKPTQPARHAPRWHVRPASRWHVRPAHVPSTPQTHGRMITSQTKRHQFLCASKTSQPSTSSLKTRSLAVRKGGLPPPMARIQELRGLRAFLSKLPWPFGRG